MSGDAEHPRDAGLVLICDDDETPRSALAAGLDAAGFEPVVAGTIADALREAEARTPVAAIHELVLPDGDGLDLCRSLRAWSAMPILVVTRSADEDDKVRALDAGADDVVTKPVSPREVAARLRAHLRRAPVDGGGPVIRYDDLEIDLAARVVRRSEGELHLTPMEFKLLRVLVLNRGRLMTHGALLAEIWGPDNAGDLQTLRTCVNRLRAKVQPRAAGGARHILTIPGVGYRFT
ncbi:MAG TPA: response regulator transcription factor [Baekduia sp.]